MDSTFVTTNPDGSADSWRSTDIDLGAIWYWDRGGVLQDAYLRELAAHEDAVAQLARRHGLQAVTVGDRLPFEQTVVAMLAGKGVRA